tara:strand:- start:488 stop:643 length:156 start_codon:yes stop_codon:yes gene_type:complete
MSRISEKAIGMFNIVQVKGDDAGGYYGTQAITISAAKRLQIGSDKARRQSV